MKIDALFKSLKFRVCNTIRTDCLVFNVLIRKLLRFPFHNIAALMQQAGLYFQTA